MSVGVTRPQKGRGALSNGDGRYESRQVEHVDDGWERDDPVSPVRTRTIRDASRSILARNSSPDVPFDVSINTYRGCEHGCVYCFARPTHAHLGLSPGLDFETRILNKPDAPELLEREFRRSRYTPEVIAIGTNTDAYQPLERKLGITRRVLEVLAAHEHPVSIVTKSDAVLRDLDILAPMARRNLVRVHLSVTTLDPELARRMEPRATTPSGRVAAVRALVEAGIPCGVLMAPIVPALNDAELEEIIGTAAAAGAVSVGGVLLRLPLEVAALFEEWLGVHYPDRAEKVLALMRGARGGSLYDPSFGARMRGSGPWVEVLWQRFAAARRRHGLLARIPALDCSRFRVPGRGVQLGLFGG